MCVCDSVKDGLEGDGLCVCDGVEDGLEADGLCVCDGVEDGLEGDGLCVCDGVEDGLEDELRDGGGAVDEYGFMQRLGWRGKREQFRCSGQGRLAMIKYLKQFS